MPRPAEAACAALLAGNTAACGGRGITWRFAQHLAAVSPARITGNLDARRPQRPCSARGAQARKTLRDAPRRHPGKQGRHRAAGLPEPLGPTGREPEPAGKSLQAGLPAGPKPSDSQPPPAEVRRGAPRPRTARAPCRRKTRRRRQTLEPASPRAQRRAAAFAACTACRRISRPPIACPCPASPRRAFAAPCGRTWRGSCVCRAPRTGAPTSPPSSASW